MDTALHFTVLLAAVVCGWLLGRLSRKTVKEPQRRESAHYYRGLAFLLSEQPSAAVNTVIEELPVDEETLPTHLALANLMRNKGELESATRIHQNLLSRPTLAREKLHQVHLELAKDYISAGLLDRAERLLRDLADESSSYRLEALERLQHIYQSEREWERAVAVALQRLPRKGWLRKARGGSDGGDESVERALSHYYCELAEAAIVQADFREARRILAKARRHSADNPRAVLLTAKLALGQGDPNHALRLLHELAVEQAPFAAEIMPLYRDAFAKVADRRAYINALKPIAEQSSSTALILEVARAIEDEEGRPQAAAFLASQANARPTLSLLAGLTRYQSQDSLPVVASTIEKIQHERPVYRCRHCGFSGRKLHWLCPSCEQWGTIAPIRGTLGD